MQLFEIASKDLWSVLGWDCLVLGIVTAIANLHPKIRKLQKVRDAINSWWPVVIVATAGVFFGPIATLAVFAGISCILVYEGMKLLGLPERTRKFYTCFGILQTLACHALVLSHPVLAPLLPLMTGLLILPMVQLIAVGPQNSLKLIGGVQWIINSSTTLFLFVSLIVLYEIKPHPWGGQGTGILFFTLVIISDGMQYVGGKLLGKTPLIPHVSPNKTVEGMLFGMSICALAGGLLAPRLLATTPLSGAILGFSVCALGLVGDLIVSSWKRDAGVKDTGNVLPGQGGILDRCDSILFVAPWFWFLTNFVF